MNSSSTISSSSELPPNETPSSETPSSETPPSETPPSETQPNQKTWAKPNIVYDYEKYTIGDNTFFDVAPSIAIVSIIINIILLMILPRYNRNYSIFFGILILALSIPQLVIYLGKNNNKNIILYYLSITTLFIGCGTIIGGNEISGASANS